MTKVRSQPSTLQSRPWWRRYNCRTDCFSVKTKQSRKMYCRSERKRAALECKMAPDPLLDDLCGYGVSGSIWDMPGDRRERLITPKHIFPFRDIGFPVYRTIWDGIEPTRVFSIWRDRRDLRLWVTVWVVLLLGFIGDHSQCFLLGTSSRAVENR